MSSDPCSIIKGLVASSSARPDYQHSVTVLKLIHRTTTKHLAWQQRVLMPWPTGSWVPPTQTCMQMWRRPPFPGVPQFHPSWWPVLNSQESGTVICQSWDPERFSAALITSPDLETVCRVFHHKTTLQSDPRIADTIRYTATATVLVDFNDVWMLFLVCHFIDCVFLVHTNGVP